MLEQPIYALGPTSDVRALVHDNAWATIVSANGDDAPVVSHFPVLLDPEADDATVLGHLPTEDAELHRLGEREVVLVVEGPNGYISPSWYHGGDYVPTWNYVVVHLHGQPELLDAAGTYRVLEMTVEHFETSRPDPWQLSSVDDYAHSIAPWAIGFRLRPTRIASKGKLSQDKPTEVIERVIDALQHDPVHGNAALAATMRRKHPAGA